MIQINRYGIYGQIGGWDVGIVLLVLNILIFKRW